MTDQPDQPDQLDADDGAVRRLLADARHTGPMPADVVARLDAVLADLPPYGSETSQTSETSATPDRATDPVRPVVVPLDARRRRRAAGMLVAAAAIVVGGIAVAQHLPTSSPSGEAASADNQASRVHDSAGGHALKSPGPVESRPNVSGKIPEIRHGRVVVRPRSFTADALAARSLLDREAQRLSGAGGSACVDAPLHGRALKATYQRAPALLVFHRPTSSSQVVDLFVCGSSRPVRSATVPSP